MVEQRAKRRHFSHCRAASAVTALAWRREGAHLRQVAGNPLVPGDWVVVKPGERIPVDGALQEGRATLMNPCSQARACRWPRALGHGARWHYQSGWANFVQAEAVGSETTLAKIIRLVESAQAAKAPIQRLVDKISGVFVPVVIVLALSTFC